MAVESKLDNALFLGHWVADPWSATTMKCYSLILGARNTRAAKRRFLKRDDSLIRSITAKHFPEGFTILNADGSWFDPSKKTFVEESSRQILICAKGLSPVRIWCADLAAALGQEELLVLELGAARTFKYKTNETPAQTRRRG